MLWLAESAPLRAAEDRLAALGRIARQPPQHVDRSRAARDHRLDAPERRAELELGGLGWTRPAILRRDAHADRLRGLVGLRLAGPRHVQSDPIGVLELDVHGAGLLRHGLVAQLGAQLVAAVPARTLFRDLQRDAIDAWRRGARSAHAQRRSLQFEGGVRLRRAVCVHGKHPEAARIFAGAHTQQALKLRNLDRNHVLALVAERIGRDAQRIDRTGWNDHRDRCAPFVICLDRTVRVVPDMHLDRDIGIGAELHARRAMQRDLRPGHARGIVADQRQDRNLRVLLFRRRVQNFVAPLGDPRRSAQSARVRIQMNVCVIRRAEAHGGFGCLGRAP